MLRVVVNDSESNYEGIFETSDHGEAIQAAVAYLQENCEWNRALEFYSLQDFTPRERYKSGPEFLAALGDGLQGILADPAEVIEYNTLGEALADLLEYDGTARVFVREMQLNTMQNTAY